MEKRGKLIVNSIGNAIVTLAIRTGQRRSRKDDREIQKIRRVFF